MCVVNKLSATQSGRSKMTDPHNIIMMQNTLIMLALLMAACWR